MTEPRSRPDKARFTAAQGVFFPAAALQAALVLPLSVDAMLNGRNWLPGLARSTGHAHEMLFGFALAVVAGFLINRIERRKLWLLFGLWLGARLSFMLLPQSVISHLMNLAFAGYFAAMAAPQFFNAAKKWRNQIFAPTVVGLGLAVAAFHLGSGLSSWRLQTGSLREAVILLALLMAFMGGRVIAPAVAGYFQTLGRNLETRVQPRLEAVLLIFMLCALVTALWPVLNPVTGLLLTAAAAVAGVRLVRWRLWVCYRRVDLLCLGAGYLWLVVGLLLLGSSYLFSSPNPTVALHAITVGALGTLTLTIMARTRIIKARQHPGHIPGLWLAAVLVSVAAVLRLVGAYSSNLLVGAAIAWSLAFAVLLVILLRTPAKQAS